MFLSAGRPADPCHLFPWMAVIRSASADRYPRPTRSVANGHCAVCYQAATSQAAAALSLAFMRVVALSLALHVALSLALHMALSLAVHLRTSKPVALSLANPPWLCRWPLCVHGCGMDHRLNLFAFSAVLFLQVNIV